MASQSKPERVLAVASGGGHWVQLFRLRKAWDGCDVSYATADSGHRDEVLKDAEARQQAEPKYFKITEANRWNKFRLIRQALELIFIVLRVRPDIVISTGAAPGYFAIRIAHMLGARTVWVDSIANAEELSFAGRKVGRHADLWLTQWQNLAKTEGPVYRGAVL